MADLEERVYAEALVQFRAQTAEGLVGEEDGALDFGGDVVDGARVAEAERGPSVLEGVVGVEQSVEDGVGGRRGAARDIEGREGGEGVDEDGLLLVDRHQDGDGDGGHGGGGGGGGAQMI